MFIVSLRGGARIPCNSLAELERICDMYLFMDPVILNSSGQPVSVTFRDIPCLDSEY